MAVTDLVIDAITAPVTVERNATFDFSYVVKNVGTLSTGRAFGTAAALDDTPTYPDDAAGSVFGLGAGATKTLSGSFSTVGLGVGEHTIWVLADDSNAVTEGDESNNLTSVTFTIVNTKPDFTVTSLAVDQSSVVEGENLDFSYLVENLGGSASETGSIFYNFDVKPDLSHRTGPIRGADLEAGGSTLISDSINTTGLSAGTHTLWIGVDATKAKSENDETNNFTSVTFTVTARPKPDQIIESITGPTTVVQGGDLNFSYVLKDANSANTTNSFGAIIFAVDRQPTAGSYDYVVGAGTLPGGGSLTFNEVLHANLSVGEHTLWLKADGLGNVSEANESNNLRSFTFTVTAPAPNPDLSIVSINGPTTIEKGFSLNLGYTIKNVGTLPSAASNVGYMIDQAADSTHYLSAPTLGALAADGTQSLTAAINTSNLSVGTHTVWFAADVFGSVMEVSESNNTGSFTFVVTAAQPHPDLVVSGLALGNASVVQGQNLGFVYTIVNDGAAQSNLGYANFYIDGFSEAHFRGSNVTDPLGVGASRTIYNGFNTADLSVGQHTLWIGADNFGQTSESNETNNWRSITFEVTAPPQADLVVSNLGLGAASVVQGQALGFVYTIVNDGAAQSNLGYANFYIDGFSEAHFRGSNVTDPLGAGASRTIYNGFNTADLSVGQHTLWIGADNFGQTSESNESNNWRSITFEVTAPPQADLVVSNLGLGAASVVQGQNLGFVYTIVNDGAAQSNLGYANFYIDGFSEAHFRGSNVTDPLGVGASRTIYNGFNTADLSVGQHTLWIGADNFGQTSESNESNNWRGITFEVTAPPQADLVVSNLGLGAASVVQGQALGFVYTIVNDGAAQSNLGYANFYIDGFSEAHFRGSNVTDPLGVGASRTIYNGFNTADLSVGQHTLWIGADNFGQTSESNESNNWRAITFEVTAPPQAGSSGATMVSGGTLTLMGMSTVNGQVGLADGTSDFYVVLSPLTEWSTIL